MLHKYSLFLMVILLCILTQACSLLPKEDTPLSPPVIRAYEAKDIITVNVMRGNVIKTVRVNCFYVPFNEKNYYFRSENQYIESIHVSVGDAVSKGRLLAELDRREILANIENIRLEISRQELRLEYARSRIAIEREQFVLDAMKEEPYAGGEESFREKIAAQEKKLAETIDSHTFTVMLEQKQLDILNQKLNGLLELADERAIFAEFDGTVTYVKKLSSGDRSSPTDRIVTVSDNTAAMAVFSSGDTDPGRFKNGERYVMTISGGQYTARVVSPEEIGAPPPLNPAVLFLLEDYGYDSTPTAPGTIDIETDRRDNVLFLPAKAVCTSADKTFVYFLDESGVKRIKYIETGLSAGDKVEITGGLTEDEEVIIE